MNEETDRIYHVLDGSGDDHKMLAAHTIVHIVDSSGVCGVGI